MRMTPTRREKRKKLTSKDAHDRRNLERNRSKYWPTLVNIIDGQFPKGTTTCRGRALVALAYIELMLTGTKFDEHGEPL